VPVSLDRIVLIVAEPTLRSTLAARLAMSGVDVITAKNFEDPSLARLAAPAVLVTDERALGDHEGCLALLLARRQWHRVIVIPDEPPQDQPHPGAFVVERGDAPARIAALIRRWREEPDA
jgi:hypothetical protein